MDLHVDDDTREALEQVRAMGQAYLRPLGLEADRLNRPIPAGHPFFTLVAQSGYMEREVQGALRPRSEDDESESRRGGGSVRTVLVVEEGSYWDRGAMVTMPGPGLGGPPVSRMGTQKQKERFLGIFGQRERPLWGAFAMTEPGAGSDVARIQTRAKKDGDEWVLTGQKMFSSNSARAEWVVVFATVDPARGRAGHRAFVVEKGTPGFEFLRLEHKMGLRAYETGSFALDDCRVSADHLLGGERYYEEQATAGFQGAMAAFNATRPVVAAMGVGIARAAHDVARDFVRDEFPAHAAARRRRALERLADVRRGIEIARLLCLRAAGLLDAGQPNALAASMAKLYAPPVSLRAVETAMLVLGEAGVHRDRMLEKLARDVKAIDIVEGTQQIQRRIVARHLIGRLDSAS